jgi:hypothetical protein
MDGTKFWTDGYLSVSTRRSVIYESDRQHLLNPDWQPGRHFATLPTVPAFDTELSAPVTKSAVREDLREAPVIALPELGRSGSCWLSQVARSGGNKADES